MPSSFIFHGINFSGVAKLICNKLTNRSRGGGTFGWCLTIKAGGESLKKQTSCEIDKIPPTGATSHRTKQLKSEILNPQRLHFGRKWHHYSGGGATVWCHSLFAAVIYEPQTIIKTKSNFYLIEDTQYSPKRKKYIS